MLAGCTGGRNEPAPKPAATSTHANPARWEDGGRSAAVNAAEKILTTWARPKLAYEQWWAELKPMLSPEAREAYEYTDPAQIPSLKVTGLLGSSNDDNPHVVTIAFDTTKGKFGVDMSRTSIPGKWIGENIIFPGDTSRLQ